MPAINWIPIRAQVTDALGKACGYIYTILRKNVIITANHAPVISTSVDYQVYGVSDRIHQFATPGALGGEKITTQLLFASADNIPDDEDTSVARQWVYIDRQGKEHSVAEVRPVRPDGAYTVQYEIELIR